MADVSVRIDDSLDQAVTTASSRLAAVEGLLKGSGEQTREAFKKLQQAATALPSAGSNFAAQMQQLQEDDSVPGEYRIRKAAEIRETGETVIAKLGEAARAALAEVEQVMAEAVVPSPARDPGERQLVRGELGAMLAGQSGPQLVARMVAIVEQGNDRWTAELASEWGRAQLIAAGAGNEWANFRGAALAKLLEQTGGTERQQANRAALLALHRGNVRGQVAGLQQIARHRLRNGR